MNQLPDRLPLRRLFSSPAYRLGVAGSRHRLLGTVVWLLVLGGIWIGSAVPTMTTAHPYLEPLLMVFGRVLGIPLFLTVACIRGAMAFAPERRRNTADQLVLLPLSAREKLLARSLAAAAPIACILAFLLLAELAICSLSPGLNRDPDFIIYLAVLGTSLSATTALIFSLGVWSSLRAATVGRAVALGLLLGILVLGAEWFLFGTAAFVLDYMRPGDGAEIAFAVLALLAHMAASTILAAFVLRSCTKHLDEWLLREG